MPRTNGGNINFNVNMTVNKNGLNQILKPLQQIQNRLNSVSTEQLKNGFDKAAESAKQLESIINSSWNDKLGQLNLDKFNQSIKSSYGGVSQLKNSLAGAGTAGQAAFNSLASQVLNTNLQLRESNKLLDDMATSMANTVKWGITSSIFNNITGSIQKAFYYAKDLDTSLNNIRIVTGDSADQMQRFAKTANNAAKDLGRSTLDYTNAALSFYQQGLNDEQVAARTQTTLKAQNITGVGTEMVDYLTAVWNGFNIEADQTEEIVDKLAKVADSSASDMSELAIAMSKVASTANVMGVGVDSLTAQLATVIATTRQAPESVGTAFKTIYSRLNDIKTGADDAQVSLGNYSGKMAELGFSVLDANGRLRDTQQVIEQVGSRWQTLTKEQQVSLAQIMGGMRQVNQITALFENWTMYSELLNDSLTAQGSLNEKNDIYLQSTAAHMEQLRAETERTYDILFNQDTVNSFTDIFRGALDLFNDYISGIGGGANVFLNLGATVANVFNKQIGTAINNQIQSIEILKNNLAQIKAQQEWSQTALDTAKVGHATNNDTVSQAALEKQATITQRTLQVRKALTQEQYNQLQELQRQVGVEQTRIDYLEQYKTIALNILDTEDASTREFQERLAIQQQTLQAEEKRANAVARATQFYRQNIDDEEQALNLAIALQAASNSELLTEQQKIRLAELQIKLEDGQKLTEQEIKEILELQNNAISKQRALVEQVNQGLQGRKAAEDGTLQQLKGQQEARERIIVQQQDQAARQIAIQNAVRIATGVIQGLSAVVGGVSTAMDQTATASQRANGAWSAFSGAVSGGLMAINPMFGLMASGILNLGKSLLQATGYWDQFEDRFRTTKEKIEEFNKSIQEAGQVNQRNTAQIASLEQIKQEYETLSNKVGQYGSTIDKLTDEEKTRYHELTNEFAQYNQAVIVGYDEQGNAIVRGQQALLDTIQVLKQAKKQANAAALGSSEEVLSGIATSHTKDTNTPAIQDARARLEKLEGDYAATKQEVQRRSKQDPELLQAELANYAIAVNQALNNPDNFKIWQYSIGENNQTFKQLYNKYLDSLSEVISVVNGQKVKNQQKLGQALSLGNLLKDAIDKYASNDVDLDYYTALLSDYNNQILQQIQKARDDAQNTVNELQNQASQVANYTQKDANAIILAMQTFDDIGIQYQKLQEKAQSIGASSSSIDQLLSKFITSFTDQTRVQQLIADTQDYATKLQNVLTESYSAIAEKLSETDLSDFEGSVTEYTEHVTEIINQILSQLDPDKFQDESARQALANILAQSLDLSNVQIKLNDDGKLGVDVDSVATKAQDDLKNAQQAILDTLSKFGYRSGNDNREFSLDLLSDIFNTEELADFDTVINQINWGAFLKYAREGANAGDALKQAWAEAEQVRDQAKDISNLDFDTVFNAEDVLKHVQAKKKLTDQEENYLSYLEQQDAKLRQIAEFQGRSSDAYATRLAELRQLGQDLYKSQLENQKERVQTELDNAQAVLNSANASAEARAEAESKVAEYKQQLLHLDYDIARAEDAISQNVKARAQAEREAAAEKAKSDYNNAKDRASVIPSAKDAVTSLGEGKTLKDNEAYALAYLENSDENLKRLGESNRYSKQYVDALKAIIEARANIQQQARDDMVAALQEQKALLEKQRDDLKAQLVSDQDYAKALTVTEDNASPAAYQAAQKIVTTYQQQNEGRQHAIDLDNQILDKQAQIVAVTTQEIEQMRTALQSLEDFRSMSETLRSGKELSGQDQAEFTQILDQLLQKYPELTNAAETLKQTWLNGTDAYQEALTQVNDALQNVLYEELQDKLDQAFQDIDKLTLDIAVNPEQFENWMDQVEQFLDADKQITIAVHSEAESEFERLSEQMDTLYDAASKIGEGFVVAADDLRELNAVFPGIIQGMQQVDAGSYQLNSDIAQRAIATAQTEINADAESVKARLSTQAQLLHQKAAIYGQMADACQALAEDEVSAQTESGQAIATLSTGLAEIKGINSKLSAQQQMDNEQKVADSSDANARITAANWASSSQSSANSIAQFANFAISAFQNVAAAVRGAMQGVPAGQMQGPPSIGSGYSGTGGQTNEASVLQGLESQLKTGGPIKRSDKDKYRALQEATQNQANDIDAMIAAIEGNQRKVSEGLDNVAGGSGIKGGSGSKGKKGGKGKKGSGGKGKKNKQKKTKDPHHMDSLDEQVDRYHDIDLQIKSIEKSLEAVQDQQDKLTRGDLIKNLNAQLAILEQQVGAYETKIELAQQERDELRNNLQAQGVQFDDATGAIDNYSVILQKKLNEVNDIIAHYNNLTAEQQKAYKLVVQAAKKDYQKFKKNIQNYDKLVSETLPDLRKEIQQVRDKQIEIQISKFKMKIQLELDMSKATKDWNAFRKKVINQVRKDDIVGNANASLQDINAYFNNNGQGVDLIPTSTDYVNRILEELSIINSGGVSSIFGTDKAKAEEELKETTSTLMKSMQDYQDILDDVKQSFFDMIDKAEDAFDEQKGEYQFLGKLINHDKKLIELLYGKDSAGKLSQYYQQQREADDKELDFLRREKEFWQDRMDQSKSRMQNLDKESNAYKEEQERYKAFQEQWMAATEGLNDKIIDSIQNITDQYKNNLSIIFDDLDKRLTGGKGMEYISDEWDLINQEADMYLDKVNSMAGIQGFQDAAQAAIKDNEGNLKAQKSLTSFMNEQLKFLKDKDKLTQYDVDRANMLLQIEIKRLALENARQNKSKLRLRRDSQGNYTYQYTADEDDTKQKEKALRDAQVDLYNFDKEEYKSNLDDVKDLTNRMMDQLKELYEEYPVWTEQAEMKKQLIMQKYGNMINSKARENENIRVNLTDSAIQSLANLYGIDTENFQKMADAQKQIFMGQILPYWKGGVQAIIDTVNGQGGLGTITNTFLEDIGKAQNEYKEGMEQTQEMSGVNFEKIGQGQDENIDKTYEQVDANQQLMDSYAQEVDAIRDVMDQVQSLIELYQTAKEQATQAAQAAWSYWQQELKYQGIDTTGGGDGSDGGDTTTDQSTKKKSDKKSDGLTQLTSDTDSKGSTAEVAEDKGGSGSAASSDTIEGIAAAIWMDGSASGWGDNPGRRKKFIEKFNSKTADAIQSYINAHAENGDIYKEWSNKRDQLKNYYYSKFDTGGYTGDWGPNGKLGILHEKELVLNAQDTANLLAAVNVVRSIDELLSSITANTNLPDLLSGTVNNNTSNQNVNQNVQISATFPAVNSRLEIEQAFSNLVNRASQYAFNTNR